MTPMTPAISTTLAWAEAILQPYPDAWPYLHARIMRAMSDPTRDWHELEICECLTICALSALWTNLESIIAGAAYAAIAQPVGNPLYGMVLVNGDTGAIH